MDDDTPPKRITRSRATAKTSTTEPEVKIATAAAKAKAMRNAVSTATKRKTRSDDVAEETNSKDTADGDQMDVITVKPKVTRGRKKVVPADPEVESMAEEEAPVSVPAPVRSTRRRLRQAIEEPPPPPEPLKATRGRLKKVIEEPPPNELIMATRGRGRSKKAEATEEPAVEAVVEAVKKNTRGRPAATAKAPVAPKKSVKFEEPQEQDKENIVPNASTKDKRKDIEAATGLRAKPVKKPAVSTRGRAKVAASTEKLPLTPKKATQVATAKDNVSEDELATMEKTPMKPLMKSPVRAPGSVLGTARKIEFTTSIIANRAATQDHGSSLMGSPARRPPQSPYKDALKTSPKRVNLGDSMLKSPFKTSMQPLRSTNSPFMTSMLQSPAKRPKSPMKVSAMGSPSRNLPTMGATPKPGTFGISKFGATPRTLTKSAVPPIQSLFGSPSKQTTDGMGSTDPDIETATAKPFSGRLSSILPRDADPALQEPIGYSGDCRINSADAAVIEEDESSVDQIVGDAMVINEEQQTTNPVPEAPRSTTPTQSPPRHSIGTFSLRDQDPFQDSDSEDELAFGSPKYSPAPLRAFNMPSKGFAAPATPTHFVGIHMTPKTAVMQRSTVGGIHIAARSQSVKARREQIGFTSLARQPNDCVSAAAISESSSSSSSEDEPTEIPIASNFDQGINAENGIVFKASPAKSTFFEDAMSVSDEAADGAVNELQIDSSDGIDAMDFAPTSLDNEDIALAAEADEMSLIATEIGEDVEGVVDILSQSIHGEAKAISEASQEYGDENATPIDHGAIPIDPALLALDVEYQPRPPLAPHTPVRVLGERERVFHTVSKVPLKPAAADSPLKINKYSASVSKLAVRRDPPASPSFSVAKLQLRDQPAMLSSAQSNNWSTTVTPVRTPRRDINNQVLKGVVVYVDVHTTEGADASAVFVELLGQMGARCIKNWSWNPNGNHGGLDANAEINGSSTKQGGGGSGTAGSNKIGITHVVFKDGGKRTLEKVKESNGVVLCVGVAWVLDCERQQTWLPESPYAIDTALIPRGGRRRRKSMEPRSIQNLNGTLSLFPNSAAGTPRSVSASHAMSPTKEFLNIPDTPGTNLKTHRRKSTLWTRSPSSDGGGIDNESGLMLSPVPVTPAPEAISAYAEHILENGSSPDGAATPYFLRKEGLIQRTCPPKQASGEMERGYGELGIQEGGEGSGGVLMQRLLLARRKSLQWAPKVGSPLAKGAFGV